MRKKVARWVVVMSLVMVVLTLFISCSETTTLKVGMNYSSVISIATKENIPIWEICIKEGSLHPFKAILSTDLSKLVPAVIVILIKGDYIQAVFLKNTGKDFIVTEFSYIDINDAIKLISQSEVWRAKMLGEYYKLEE